MQNKGAITLLAIALALVSLYQLSFTWKTNRVEKVAREYAQGDPVKEKVYLDSIANKEVYNFLGIAQYTYKECKELELNLGLDLRGGMNVTMEVDVVDVVRSLANYSQDLKKSNRSFRKRKDGCPTRLSPASAAALTP